MNDRERERERDEESQPWQSDDDDNDNNGLNCAVVFCVRVTSFIMLLQPASTMTTATTTTMTMRSHCVVDFHFSTGLNIVRKPENAQTVSSFVINENTHTHSQFTHKVQIFRPSKRRHSTICHVVCFLCLRLFPFIFLVLALSPFFSS